METCVLSAKPKSVSKSSEETEEDPVVKEIPVFLSKRLDKQLYVFQYPLCPKTDKTLNVTKADFKPNNKEVKLDVAINTETHYFDTYKAEQLAEAVNATGSSKSAKKQQESKIFEGDLADKVFYTSSKVTPNVSSYAIGSFNGSGYYLTPLEGYLQLRPSLEYLNRYLKGKKSGNEKDVEMDEVASTSKAFEAVTVQIAKGEGKDGGATRKEMSYQSLQELSNQEKWVSCLWSDGDSHDRDYLKGKLMSDVTDDCGHLFNAKGDDYVRMLVPEDEQAVQVKPALPSNVVSLQALKALSVQEQIRLLLKDAKIINFEQLKMLLTSGQRSVNSEILLNNLPQSAVLVKGNWVVKSEILYPPNTFSSVSGVSSELMCRARDYVLYLFTKNQYVERRKVSATIRLPAEEVKEIFTGVAKLKHNKGWQLLAPPDDQFQHKHAEVCQRQSLFWEQRWQQLNEFYKDIPKEKRRRKSKSISEEQRKSDKEDSDSASTTTTPTVERNKSPVAAKVSKKDVKSKKS